MREEEPNWFSRWEEELPAPDELMPLSQTLITPDLALAFDIPPPLDSTPNHNNNNHHHHHHHHGQSLPQSQSQSGHQQLQPDYDSSEIGGSGGAGAGVGDDQARTLKRPRLVWTPQLHKRFVDAVAHLGIKNAVPKTIMQLMSVDGLTRENVASHLQKYRLYLKRMQGLSSGGGPGGGPVPPSDPATERLFASSPVPHHFLSRGGSTVGLGVGGGGPGGAEQFVPFMPVAALHHQQQMATAAAVAAHQQQQYYHHRHMPHLGTSPSVDHGYFGRPQQQTGVHRMVSPGGMRLGPPSSANSYGEDLDSGAEGGGRKVLTLFPTNDD